MHTKLLGKFSFSKGEKGLQHKTCRPNIPPLTISLFLGGNVCARVYEGDGTRLLIVIFIVGITEFHTNAVTYCLELLPCL